MAEKMQDEAKRPSTRDLRLDRARALLDAFGADRARWPEEDRALFDRFADDYRFAASQREAEAFDAALDAVAIAPASDDLKARLLALAPARAPRGAAKLTAPLAGFWGRSWMRLAPAGAMAGVVLAAFSAGLASAGSAGSATAASSAAENSEAAIVNVFALGDTGEAI